MAEKSTLSADARIVGTALFAFMTPGSGIFTVGMVESRPTARTQAALDELVAEEYLRKFYSKISPSVSYHLERKIPHASLAMIKKAGKFLIMEPVEKKLKIPDGSTDAEKIACVVEAVRLIEEKRKIAALLDPQNAPFPMVGKAARAYQQGKADAYQYALEMLNASWFGLKD